MDDDADKSGGDTVRLSVTLDEPDYDIETGGSIDGDDKETKLGAEGNDTAGPAAGGTVCQLGPFCLNDTADPAAGGTVCQLGPFCLNDTADPAAGGTVCQLGPFCLSTVTCFYLWKVLSYSMFSNKSKVVPYSITSVGHGADPGFLAVSPQMTLVINPVLGCRHFLPGSPLHYLTPLCLCHEAV